MTSTTETANSGVDQSQTQTLPNQEPVSPVSDNETTAEQQTEPTDQSNAETTTTSPKKEPIVKPTIHKLDYEKDVVYLYQFSRCPTIPSASPFCLKVENWLRMNGIQYENVDHKMKYKSKKGQLPFVELNGKEIADSDIIIRELSQHFDKDLDFGLTEEQKNVSHAFESMLNNHTSWVVRWWRYNNPQEFLDAAQLDIKRTLNSKLPNALLNIIFKIGFKKNVKQAIGHGLGRHSTEEIYDFGKSDLKAISEYLADKEYFFGKEPHLLDCVAFAHLTQFLYIPFAGMKEWMETETSNLVALVDRMRQKYWSDWETICNTLDLNTHLPKKESTIDKTEEEAKKDELKKEEERKKKEEKKRVQEEKKKEREEKKKKDKEEKERKKKEKEEKEKEEKEKKEREEKEKKEKEEKERKEREEKEKEEKDNKEKEEKEKVEKEEKEKEDKDKEEKPATETEKASPEKA